MRKDLRMRSPKLFERTYSQGKTVATKDLVLYFLRRERDEGTRVGFSVSRKVGNAIIRNRTKRRLRSVIDSCSSALSPGFLLVFVVRPAAADSSFADLRESAEGLLRRADILGGR